MSMYIILVYINSIGVPAAFTCLQSGAHRSAATYVDPLAVEHWSRPLVRR